MNKKIKIIAVASIFLLCLFAVPAIVFSEDYVAHYDAMFEDGEFTINTNETYEKNNAGLTHLVANHIAYRYVKESGDYMGDFTRLNLRLVSLDSCNYESMKCNILLYRDSSVNGEMSYEDVKTYENIKIIINEENDFFDFVNEDNKIEINYDESLFLNETEKNEYIWSYILRKGTNIGEGKTSFYNYDSSVLTLTRKDSFISTDELVLYAVRVISGVEFNYIETPYSDDFKKLTSGTITIKMSESGVVNKDILSDYIMSLNLGQLYFDISSDIVNNKALIELYEWEEGRKVVKEKHVVEIVKDTDIDSTLFSKVGVSNSLNVNMPEPSELSQFSSYTNNMDLRISNEDGSYYTYDVINNSKNSTYNVYVRCVQRKKNGDIINIQYLNVPVNFNGYNSEMSNIYSTKIGNKLVVKSDNKDYDSISRALNYEYTIMNCDENYTSCDIGLRSNDKLSMEIHRVDIEFDNTISSRFKKAFNINSDDTMDIIIDEGLDLDYGAYYFYDKNTNDSLIYDNYSGEWELTLDNYLKDIHESHVINVNEKSISPSQYFESRIGTNREFYIGENATPWVAMRYHEMSKVDGEYYQVMDCDEDNSTCVSGVRNSDNTLEIHRVNITFNTGKSEEYSKALPETSVKLNAIYKDDMEYLYMISMAKLIGKTKKYMYLEDYNDGKAKIILDGFETHTIDVEFEEGNPEHKAIVDEINERITDTEINILSTDLEFINSFYYDGRRGSSIRNFNSKKFNDALTKVINNKHVAFYTVPEGAAGDMYTSVGDAKIVLYYDGIAYAVSENYFTINNSNIIYIPDDTPETTEAYIAAAQKRVDDYLGEDSGVTIRFNSRHDKSYIYAPGENTSYFEAYGIDLEKFNGEDYIISRNGIEDYMLIIKDSSKIQKGSFVAYDVGNNIIVSSDTANYPTNTIVTGEIVDNDSTKQKELLNKYGVKNAQIVDINLFSPTIGDIVDFDDEEFEVNVPIIDPSLEDEDLSAIYIGNDGNVEEYPIQSDGYMGKFDTSHFSEYVIVKTSDVGSFKQSATNPKTFDNVYSYVIIGFVSLLMLVLSIIYKKRFN